MELTHKKFLITSLPFTAASVSVPLIGAVDTAIAGGLGSYHYINSVALGSVIFSTIFWLFNFLGLTASGFASQSLGSGNKQEELCAFLRGSILACGIGLVIILLQNHIFNAAVQFFNPPAETLAFMRLYFNIIVYTVPAALFYQTALGIVYYGVFNGTLQTTPICISMLFTAASYLLAKAALVPELGNSGLWLAFLVFYVARSGFLLIFVPSLLKKFPYRT